MFYQENLEEALRFGDVVSGFISSIPNMMEPNIDHKHPEYKLELSMPDFCVVLSPCCSIGSATITLVKLEQVQGTFYKNPYFANDLTNINRLVQPEKSLPPNKWENLTPDERDKKMLEGNAYAFMELFIYSENNYLPKYKMPIDKVEREIGYYQIDFRKSFRVSCQKIKNAKESPIEVKILQLSVNTREELRNKISTYYSRAPREDLVLLQAA